MSLVSTIAFNITELEVNLALTLRRCRGIDFIVAC